MKEILINTFLFAFLLSSCHKDLPDPPIINPEIKVYALGHGGMGFGNTYPVNTYESILRCIHLGADGVELDVQMTKDSVLVAFHDEQLNLVTSETGRINDYSWEQIKGMKYNPVSNASYAIVCIDTLFAHIQNINKLVFSFDNKLNISVGQYPTFINAINSLVDKYELEENILIEASDINFLLDIKRLRPNYMCFLNSNEYEPGLRLITNNHIDGLIMKFDNITDEQIFEVHQNEKLVQVWGTRNRQDNLDAMYNFPDYIQTDNLESLLELMN